MVPPRIIRRLIFAPLVIALTLAVVVTLPIWLLVAFLASLRLPPPQRRGMRLMAFAVIWLALESAALIACLGLWIASGFGGRLHVEASQERHYTLIRWFLSRVYGAAVRIFRLSVDIDEPELTPEEASRRLTRPVIVLSRHAGPGDSFLLVYHLLARYGRRPRIVMKAALQLDPSLDVVINRLPNAFVPRKVAESGIITEIQRLASGMKDVDALVIFPEGGNFTPTRRRRAITRLRDKGLREEAARAESLDHLLPPRPNGAIAAIESCPTADVIFVAHTGLDDLITIGDVWRKLPSRAQIRAKWWRYPADQVPRTRESQITWLFDQWTQIDNWITENRPTRLTPAE
ncbi:acyltransferase [Acrocarpospora phusangensis]|uniref:Acyltransferase n=1 Tax=Acrocarpospora phusangensis TaxID=1070424 RepID=A0A919QI07_9ACTN|nr:1-acyl-sn-glycerol-3-phosphate acyltransferase [Acrocarpospora phusangensis]GIH27973.1 acyltransferase [Acrocarpospora phusangensis]